MNKIELIKEVIKGIKYDPQVGKLYSRKTLKLYASKDVHGYYCFHALGKKWKVHRVIWFIEKGTLPNIVDHVDGDRVNNHISNLREATYKQNSYNCEIKSTVSGYKGVWKAKSGKYRASVTSNGKRIHLGYFNTPEEAATAYNKEIIKHDPKARRNKLEESSEVVLLKAEKFILEANLAIALEALRNVQNGRSSIARAALAKIEGANEPK